MGIRDLFSSLFERNDSENDKSAARKSGPDKQAAGTSSSRALTDMSSRVSTDTSSRASTDTPSIVCRTRGNSSPRGKSRVFIAFSPEDGERYPEEIVAILHKFQNCAIYYIKPGSRISQKDLEVYLSEMQLIVVAVTGNLLTKPNDALDQIVPFAEERHIPILPLMMEPDPDNLFTEKFGEAQYLEPGKRDGTAIPFEKKIEKYLLRVLVGDELAQRVRDAFAAYIFLSYRKKDRAYAQELMRMIHRNERCRDIAIWYDEYLVAGENFNESIKAALEKGLLFALVVTPSLLEEGNYVMRNEYPAAREWGKKILPVLMEETDAEALKTMYDGIPEPVDIRYGGNWEQVMEQYFYKIATTERAEDPQHNFLIGLAYLDGIDVEVDSQKAVSLITKAAESGLIEAAEKLAEMYHDGKGVARDYRASVKWLKKAADLCRDAWKKSGHFYDMVDLFTVLDELGGAYYNMRDIEAAKKTYTEMLELVEGQEESAARWLLLGCYSNMGNVEETEGNLIAAMEWYLKGLDVIRSLSLDADHQNYLSYYYLRMGGIEEQRGRLEEAQKYYEKSLEIDEKMSKNSGSAGSRCSLSIDYERLGDLSKERGNLAEAKKWYEKSYEIAEQIFEETKTEASRRDLAIISIKMGNIEKELSNPTEARNWYEKAQKISEQLYEETKSIRSCANLSNAYRKLGDIEQDLGHLAEAKKWYTESLKIYEQIAKETESVKSTKRDLSAIYSRLGDIAMKEGNLTEAKRWFKKNVDIDILVSETAEMPVYQRDLAVSYEHLGHIAKKEGNLPEAKGWYKKELDIAERLYEQTKIVEYGCILAGACLNLGEIEHAEGNSDGAQRWYEKSYELNRKLAEETDTPASRKDLFASCSRIGDIEKERGNLRRAKELYEESLEITQRLCEETNTVTARTDLSLCYSKLAALEQAFENLTAAKRLLEKSLELREELYEESKSLDAKTDLFIIYEKLGLLEELQNNYDEAKKWYLKGFELVKDLSDEAGMVESRRNYAIACDNLGRIESAQGNFSAARELLEKSLKIKERIYGKSTAVWTRTDLFSTYVNLGDLEQKAGNNSEAEKWLRRAYEIFQSVPKESITNDIGRLLIVCCRALGQIGFDQGKYSEAEKWLERVIEADWKSASPAMAVLWYTELAQVYILLGMLKESQQDTGAMKKYYEKGAKIGEQFLKPDQQGPLISIYQRLAGLEKRAGHLPETKKWCAKALAILERNYSDSDSEDILTLFYINRVNLADIEEKSGNLPAAEAWYVKSIESAQKLYEKTKSAEAYDYLAISYFRLGVLGGRISKEYVRKAYMIWRDLSEYFPDRKDFVQKRDAAWQALSQ